MSLETLDGQIWEHLYNQGLQSEGLLAVINEQYGTLVMNKRTNMSLYHMKLQEPIIVRKNNPIWWDALTLCMIPPVQPTTYYIIKNLKMTCNVDCTWISNNSLCSPSFTSMHMPTRLTKIIVIKWLIED